MRVLDLPFTAVEWVLPTELSQSLPATPTRWMVWQRSPRAVARVSSGLWDVDETPSGACPLQHRTASLDPWSLVSGL